MSSKRTRPLPRTPVALSVLNLLAERPMHPYEMRVLMRQRHHDRAFQIRESSVYDTVARLADRGLIEPVEVSREGRRPERTVYSITETGAYRHRRPRLPGDRRRGRAGAVVGHPQLPARDGVIASVGTVTAVEIMTSAGPAHVVVEESPGRPRFLAVLTHGAGGTPDTPDVLAVRDAARGLGAVTALVTQPYRVRGGRAPGSAARQDAAWAEIVAALSDGGLPLVQGGRSNGARVVCRTARQVGAAGVIALAFPLHPPGRPGQPGKSRDAELRAAGTRVLVLNGDRDPFGIPEPDDATRVVVLPGETHALSKNPAAIGEAVARWLGTLPGIGSRPPSVSGQAPPGSWPGQAAGA